MFSDKMLVLTFMAKYEFGVLFYVWGNNEQNSPE